jgi:hypothetical protein
MHDVDFFLVLAFAITIVVKLDLGIILMGCI